jgi:hypothetical protein
MKDPVTFSAFPGLASLLLVACDSTTPEITFEAAFPKPHIDLTAVLGKEFQLRNGHDTLRYHLSTGRQAAVITEAGSGDTVFIGKISRFRDVYYFSQVVNDSSCFIYAVSIQDNLIYGLHSALEQHYLLAQQIREGKHTDLIRFMSPDSSQIRLTADKKQLRNLFSTILPQMIPDTLVTSHTSVASSLPAFAGTQLSALDPEESAFLVTVYPNPTKDFVNIRLRESHRINYQLTDLKGKTVLKGQHQGQLVNIDLHHLQSGIYALTLTLTEQQRKEQETLKIIKQ